MICIVKTSLRRNGESAWCDWPMESLLMVSTIAFSSTLLDSARVHGENFPYMAVEVLKAVPVHEAIVHGFVVRAAAGRDRLRDQLIHLAAILAGQGDQHLRALR